MLDFIKNNKMAIGGVLVIALGAYAYLTYFGGSSAPLTASSPNSVSGDLLVTLGSLHTIKLDQSIFTDPTFVSLSDFGVTLPDLPAGRRNPFAPLGKSAGAAGAQTGTQTTGAAAPAQPGH